MVGEYSWRRQVGGDWIALILTHVYGEDKLVVIENFDMVAHNTYEILDSAFNKYLIDWA